MTVMFSRLVLATSAICMASTTRSGRLQLPKTKKTSQGMLRAPHLQCVIDSSARIDRKRRTLAGRAPKSQNFSSFWTPSDRTY